MHNIQFPLAIFARICKNMLFWNFWTLMSLPNYENGNSAHPTVCTLYSAHPTVCVHFIRLTLLYVHFIRLTLLYVHFIRLTLLNTLLYILQNTCLGFMHLLLKCHHPQQCSSLHSSPSCQLSLLWFVLNTVGDIFHLVGVFCPLLKLFSCGVDIFSIN